MSADNGARLEELLGFDPAKSHKLTQDVFSEVLNDIKSDRVEEAKKKAKELLVKAVDLRQQMSRLKKEFEKEVAKNEKELGKILNSISALLEGRTEEAPQEEAAATE